MADSRQDNRDSAADLEEIAAKAIEARTHLVAALEGLDEIIRLATRQGREDIVEAAEQSRQATVKAAGAFNENITGKPVNQIDPIKVDEADKAAVRADEDIKRLVAALEGRVSDLETHRDRMHALLRINEEGESTRLTDLEAFQVKIAETVGDNADLVDRVSVLEADMTALTVNMPRDEDGRLPAILTVVHTTVARSVTRVTESAKVNWLRAIVAFVVTWVVMFVIAWIQRGFIAGTTPWWVWAMSALVAIVALLLPSKDATETSSVASTTRTETAPAGSRGDRRKS